MIDLKVFRKANNLTQIELADYFGVGQGFISQMENGDRPIPKEYISKLLANNYSWDTSMLTASDQPENPAEIEPDIVFIKNRLMTHIEEQSATIKSLLDLLKAEREKVERLEEELRTYREHKGETAPAAAASSAARAV